MRHHQENGSRPRQASATTKPPPPTRKTLVFPHGDPPDVETPRAPGARPSERPTVPSVHAVGNDEADPSSSRAGSILELSASHLESDDFPDAAPSVPAPLAPDSSTARLKTDPPSIRRLREELEGSMYALRRMPRRLLAGIAMRSVLAYAAAGALAIWLVASAGNEGSSVTRGGVGSSRAMHTSAPDFTPLASRVVDTPAPPPAGGCANAGPPRMLASRAHLPSGIDVSAFESGFGIGFASGPAEAVGLRVDGSLAREADRVRVKTAGAIVKHVTVDPAREDGDGELDVRIDGEDARTVVVDGEAGAVKLRIVGDRLRVVAGGKERGTWLVPGASIAPRGKVVVPPVDLRAAARDGGGIVVVMRRGSTMWIGLLDHELAPEGALTAITRTGVATGMPTVSPYGGGAAIAWAERRIGEKDWNVVAATIGGPDDEVRNLRVIGPGMSPSLAALPDGDLLLAHAEGGAGAHRVVARRLARAAGSGALASRGEPVIISPSELNAGQPAAAVAGDGRGLVAFFAAGTGRATIVARPLACDPGL